MEAVLAKGYSLTNLLGGNLLKQDDVILGRHSLEFLGGGGGGCCRSDFDLTFGFPLVFLNV